MGFSRTVGCDRRSSDATWSPVLGRLDASFRRADLVPRRDVEVTRASLHASGRGVGYTKSPFAYLFERVA